MKLLIECTYVYDHPQSNSGIQRVVRNIISNLGAVQNIATAVPVILRNDRVYEVKQLAPTRGEELLLNVFLTRMLHAKHRYWSYTLRMEQRWPFRMSRNLRRLLFIMSKLPGLLLDVPIWVTSRWRRHCELGKRIVDVEVNSDDVLVLLDSSWHSRCFSLVETLKSKGVAIIAVIYDLIPLTHPHYCDGGLVAIFEAWFKWVAQTADGYMTISRTIRDQLQNFLGRHLAQDQLSKRWFDYFYLGTELDLATQSGLTRINTKVPFQKGCPVYLMVSTIEPRKNHGYLLDAFELLWREGISATLCLVGKVGWKCKELIQRIENHPEFNRRLFMFNDLNDSELEYCYRHARCIVLPSHVEGFGLPLVEAMRRGLPCMASDIPVFREVGSDFVAYFDLNRPQSLSDLVLRFENSSEFPAPKKLEGWVWLNWEEAAQQFLSKTLSHIRSGI